MVVSGGKVVEEFASCRSCNSTNSSSKSGHIPHEIQSPMELVMHLEKKGVEIRTCFGSHACGRENDEQENQELACPHEWDSPASSKGPF